MARYRDVHVVPDDGGWSVKREGKRRTKTYKTKEEATRAGRAMARKARSHHVIHGHDGRVQQSDSYGADPFPLRDEADHRTRKRRRFRLG